MNNIVLIYSPCQKTGKTFLSEELIKRKIINTKDSFAVYIKKISLDIHKAVSHLNLTQEEFFQTKKDEKILERKIS